MGFYMLTLSISPEGIYAYILWAKLMCGCSQLCHRQSERKEFVRKKDGFGREKKL